MDWLIKWADSRVVNGEPPLSEASLNVYRAMWGKFTTYLTSKGRTPGTADESHIAAFAATLSDGIRLRYLQLLSRVYLAQGTSKLDIVAQVLKAYRAAPARKLPAALPRHQLRVLIAALPERGTYLDIRDKALILALLGSGVKPAELTLLRLEDVALEESPPYLYIRAHGARSERAAPLAGFAVAPLKHWMTLQVGRPKDELVFPSNRDRAMAPSTLWRLVSSVLARAGVDARHIGPMLLRHSFAVRQLAEGRPSDVLQTWLGLQRRESTDNYRKLVANPGGWEPV